MNSTMDDSPEIYEFRALTDFQKKLLAILPVPSSILSIFGSSIIIVMVWKIRKTKSWIPYQRLLLAMSICDIISSVALAAGPFLYPKETSDKVWVIGNDASCSAIGFFNQLSYSGILYNGFLSVYFLCTARFAMTNKQVEKRIEPAMHLFAIGFPFVTAIVGLSMDVYAEPEVGIGCWVNRWPKFCGEGPDGTGEECLSPLVAWIFGAWIALFVLGALIVNNAVIWIFVHKRTRWNQGGGARVSRAPTIEKIDETSESHSHHSDDGESKASGKNSVMGRMSMASSFRSLNTGRASGNASVSTAQQREIQATQNRRLKLVGSQAFLFVGCYFVSNIWTYVLRLYESQTTDYVEEKELPYNYFALLVTQAVLLPLQGLFNMMVFIRPKYLRLRSDFPSESIFSVLHRVIFGEAARSNDLADRVAGKDLNVKDPNAHKGVSSLTLNSEVPKSNENTEIIPSFDGGLAAILETSERGDSSSLRASMRSSMRQADSESFKINKEEPRLVPIKSETEEPKQQRRSLTVRAATMQEDAKSRSSDSSLFMQGTGWSDSLDSFPSSRSLQAGPSIPEGSVPNISAPDYMSSDSFPSSSSLKAYSGPSSRSFANGDVPNTTAARMHTGWSSSSGGQSSSADSMLSSRSLKASGPSSSPISNGAIPNTAAARMHTGWSSSSDGSINDSKSGPKVMHTGWSSASGDSIPAAEESNGRANTRMSMNVEAKRKQLMDMQFINDGDSSTDGEDSEKPLSALDFNDSMAILTSKPVDAQGSDSRDSFLMPTGWSLDNIPLHTSGTSHTSRTESPAVTKNRKTAQESPKIQEDIPDDEDITALTTESSGDNLPLLESPSTETSKHSTSVADEDSKPKSHTESTSATMVGMDGSVRSL